MTNERANSHLLTAHRRSHNDQVALDMRLYVKKEILAAISLIISLQKVLLDAAKENRDAVMPGYTHLQRSFNTPLLRVPQMEWFNSNERTE